MFKESRFRNLGQQLDQPIERKLKHFIDVMLYQVRGGAPWDRSGPQVIGTSEATKFKEGRIKRSKGCAPGDKNPESPKGPVASVEEEFEYKIKEDSRPQGLSSDSELRSIDVAAAVEAHFESG